MELSIIAISTAHVQKYTSTYPPSHAHAPAPLPLEAKQMSLRHHYVLPYVQTRVHVQMGLNAYPAELRGDSALKEEVNS